MVITVHQPWSYRRHGQSLWLYLNQLVNTLRPEQNGYLFVDNIFKYILLNENCCTYIWIWISMKFVSNDPIGNDSALGQVLAWCQSGQAITGTNVDRDSWYHMTSLGLNELKCNYEIWFAMYFEMSSWRPDETLWYWWTLSTLVQVMAYSLMYLKQYWPIIYEVLWHSPRGRFSGN